MTVIELITLLILTTSNVHYTIPEATSLATEVSDAATTHGHDRVEFAVLMEQESHWDPEVVSPRKAYGIAQLNPKYWPKSDFPTRWSQLNRAAKLLREYKDLCGGDWRGMAAYRQGGKRCVEGGLLIGPATKRVFQQKRIWTNRWRLLQNHGNLQDDGSRKKEVHQ